MKKTLSLAVAFAIAFCASQAMAQCVGCSVSAQSQSYGQPVYGQPVYNSAPMSYGTPVYNSAPMSYGTPVYNSTPAYNSAPMAYSQPVYNSTPVYNSAPMAYGQPAYSQPIVSAPMNTGCVGCGTVGYSQPAMYAQPVQSYPSDCIGCNGAVSYGTPVYDGSTVVGGYVDGQVIGGDMMGGTIVETQGETIISTGDVVEGTPVDGATVEPEASGETVEPEAAPADGQTPPSPDDASSEEDT